MSEKGTPKAGTTADDENLLARLKAAEAKIQENDALIERLKAEAEAIKDGGGRKYSPRDQPFVGSDGGYEFQVTPVLPEGDVEFAHLKPQKVICCDESEAKRWYCHSNEHKKGTGIPVDPVKVRLEVKCTDRRRSDALMRQKQISVLRLKVQGGQTLSESDKALLAQCEHEIYGYEESA